MKKILLINVSGIGDIISSLIVANPLLEQGEVSYIIPKNFQGLLSDTFFTEYTTDNLPNEKFDLLIDLTTNKESRKLTQSVNASRKIGRCKNFGQKIRFFNIYNKMVSKFPTSDHITWDYKPILDYLKIPMGKTTYLKTTLMAQEKEVCIHVGADKEIRRIPVGLIVEICEYYKKNNVPVRIIGIEQDVIEEILAKTQHYPVYEKGNLADVKRWLNNSMITIASDSGLFHLASALGKKCVGLYGPNTSKRAGSINPNARFVELDFECRPCNQNIACPYDNRCMKNIQFEMLVPYL